MSIASRVARPLLFENTPLSADLIDLILNLLQSIYEGHAYTKDDLKKLPKGTHLFMLNMKINFGPYSDVNFDYEGYVDVINENLLNFEFTMSGIRHKLIKGAVFNDYTVFMTYRSSSGVYKWNPSIILLPVCKN